MIARLFGGGCRDLDGFSLAAAFLEDEVIALGSDLLGLGLTGTGTGLLKRRSGIEEREDGTPVLITVHPSYLLRLPDPELARHETALFRDDLAKAAAWL